LLSCAAKRHSAGRFYPGWFTKDRDERDVKDLKDLKDVRNFRGLRKLKYSEMPYSRLIIPL